MPNKALVLVAAAVLEARDQPSTYSSRRPGRHVPTIVDQVVSFTIATARWRALSMRFRFCSPFFVFFDSLLIDSWIGI
jgi:hypothetical protein